MALFSQTFCYTPPPSALPAVRCTPHHQYVCCTMCKIGAVSCRLCFVLLYVVGCLLWLHQEKAEECRCCNIQQSYMRCCSCLLYQYGKHSKLLCGEELIFKTRLFFFARYTARPRGRTAKSLSLFRLISDRKTVCIMQQSQYRQYT